MRFSAIYNPTTLFSLKDSSSTNSGAKSLFLPSPYAIKMAILNQAITAGGDLEQLDKKKSIEFGYVRDAKIMYYLQSGSSICVNNSFVKILKPDRNGNGFAQTVAFREYIYLSHPIEIIFEVKDESAKAYFCKYLHRINYFGKRGCFFQFIEYRDDTSEPNVIPFKSGDLAPGILQQYDDFGKVEFDNVNNFSTSSTKRDLKALILPVKQISSSKSYTHYKVLM